MEWGCDLEGDGRRQRAGLWMHESHTVGWLAQWSRVETDEAIHSFSLLIIHIIWALLRSVIYPPQPEWLVSKLPCAMLLMGIIIVQGLFWSLTMALMPLTNACRLWYSLKAVVFTNVSSGILTVGTVFPTALKNNLMNRPTSQGITE